MIRRPPGYTRTDTAFPTRRSSDLDVVEVDRRGHAGLLVEVAQVVPQARVVGQAPDVALEMPVIDGIEAQQRGEQAPVGLGLALAHQVADRKSTRLNSSH